MPEIKLLPCPFCGGEPYIDWVPIHDDVGEEQFVKCSCGASMDYPAKTKWNHRAAPVVPQLTEVCSDDVCIYCDIVPTTKEHYQRCKNCGINNYCDFLGRKLFEIKSVPQTKEAS